MNLSLFTDKNGNRRVRVKCGNHKPFSIQTNANLPECHRGNLSPREVRQYVARHGTNWQRRLLEEVKPVRRAPSLADSLALAAELETRKAHRGVASGLRALQTAAAYQQLSSQARSFSP